MTIEYLSSKRIQGVTADTKPTNVPAGTEFMNTQTGVLSIFDGATWNNASSGGITNLDSLTDVTITSVSNGQVPTWNSTSSQWENATPPGAGGGEANTNTNVGTGAQVAKTKTGVDTPLRSFIGAGRVTTTQNTNDITIDVLDKYTEELYRIYIDAADSKFKAINLSTNVVTDSGSTTDVLSLFNTVIAAASTAKKPVRIDKGLYPFSAAPTIAGKWMKLIGTRTGGYSGGKGDPTNETVIKKAYTDNTNAFFHWDGSTTWTKQQWINVVFEGKDSNNNGTGTYDDGGIGFQIKSTGTAISEIYDCFQNVMICHFGTGLKLMKCYQLTFHELAIYKCGSKGIHLTDDGTSGQCFEIIFRGGEVRLVPTNAHVEKATHVKFDNMLLEGDSASPYTLVNSVKIDSGGHVTRINKCSFENNVNGITTILNAGYGTVIDSSRFGGLTWTAQTVLDSSGTKCNFINNLIEPYANSGVATILLSSGAKHCNIIGNHVAESATSTALTITDSSGNTTTNLILGNSSGSAVIDNTIGRSTTFLSPTTINGAKFKTYSTAKTATPYNALTTDYYIPVDTTTQAITINLPTAVGNDGLTYVIYKTNTSGNAIIVDPNGSETINGQATMSFNRQHQHMRVVSNGANWIVSPDVALAYDSANSIFYTSATYFQMQNVQLLISGTGGNNNYFIIGGTIGGARLCTLPDLGADDVFTFNDATQTLKNKTINDLKENWVGKSAAYTMTDADYGVFLTGTSTYTVTLPAASGRTGKVFQFVKTGASGTVTIDANASELINTATTSAISTQGGKLKIICDGTGWWAID